MVSAGFYLLLGIITTLALALLASAQVGTAGLGDVRSMLVCGFWPVALYHYLAYLFSV